MATHARAFLVLVCIGLAAAVLLPRIHAQRTEAIREHIEWCDIWFTAAEKTDRPRVLLIGDSIARGYFDGVEKELGDRAYCGRWCTSRSICDPVFFQELALVLDQYEYRVIHFNNGLHGWGYSEDEYRVAFGKLMEALAQHAPKAQLVWASTTPVREDSSMGSHTTRVVKRNAIAAELVAARQIPIDDLFSAVHGHSGYYAEDGIHFKEEGRAVLTKQVSGAILPHLS